MVKKETYYFIDSEGLPDQRVTEYHRLLGKYVVRASRLIKTEEQAQITCGWLNMMVRAREGVGDLFKVVRYKETNTLFAVVRQLVVDDLVSGIEELVEVKPR